MAASGGSSGAKVPLKQMKEIVDHAQELGARPAVITVASEALEAATEQAARSASAVLPLRTSSQMIHVV